MSQIHPSSQEPPHPWVCVQLRCVDIFTTIHIFKNPHASPVCNSSRQSVNRIMGRIVDLYRMERWQQDINEGQLNIANKSPCNGVGAGWDTTSSLLDKVNLTGSNDPYFGWGGEPSSDWALGPGCVDLVKETCWGWKRERQCLSTVQCPNGSW